ncbi:MAG: DUF3576 domain-containing protein [Rhodospirillaceae bacterium]|nr:DUF3576 domain-containing protein [Rhodospirillaceae bacterium]MCY4066657.1 DUF3576 domain-containing protein [Rhodospirillaceae bacterium]MXW92863.1 DUF3576 domain-containing protein [Rhodospirillaceae bacterium]MYB14733.1 DUF3576 domain-containing protein [Rhodospirillaceae bacterium]MYG53664.1 DUF3576 domain-containing protein [Rhodospirillaceae bacterium]
MSGPGDPAHPDSTLKPDAVRLRRAAAVALPGLALLLAGCVAEERPTGPAVNIFERYAHARAIRPNPDLWAAAGNRLDFARKRMSDPFGGVLATNWYRPKDAPGERRRVTVTILGPALEAKNLRIAVIRQVRRGGVWRNRPVSASTVAELHTTILRAARYRAAARGI